MYFLHYSGIKNQDLKLKIGLTALKLTLNVSEYIFNPQLAQDFNEIYPRLCNSFYERWENCSKQLCLYAHERPATWQKLDFDKPMTKWTSGKYISC